MNKSLDAALVMPTPPTPPTPPPARQPVPIDVAPIVFKLFLYVVALCAFMGVIIYGYSAANDFGAADLKKIPVARSAEAFRVVPPGAWVIVEGRVGPAAEPAPCVADTATRLGLVAWQKDRFDHRNTHAGAGNREDWYAETSCYPPLLVRLTDDGTLLPLSGDEGRGGGYAIKGELRKILADTPAVRPSPRAGKAGTWRYQGVPLGNVVAVIGQRASANSNALMTNTVQVGSIANMYKNAESEGREGAEMGLAMLFFWSFVLVVSLTARWVVRRVLRWLWQE